MMMMMALPHARVPIFSPVSCFRPAWPPPHTPASRDEQGPNEYIQTSSSPCPYIRRCISSSLALSDASEGHLHVFINRNKNVNRTFEWKGGSERYYLLMTCRFDSSARMEWTTGRENFLFVKSSQYPLLPEYWEDEIGHSIDVDCEE